MISTRWEPSWLRPDCIAVDQTRVVPIVWDGPVGEVPRARETLAAAAATIAWPPGYSYTEGGGYQRVAETGRAVRRALLLAGALVLLVLAAQFESIRLPLVIFAAVPLATVGVGLALALSGSSLNALSGMGIVILTGIVVNDAILKVDLFRRLTAAGHSPREAVLLTSGRRYRPILMTTATTALALTPMLLGSGAELRAPLALTVIGGLVSATLLTLFVIPVLLVTLRRS